jgi:hypothetical protein
MYGFFCVCGVGKSEGQADREGVPYCSSIATEEAAENRLFFAGTKTIPIVALGRTKRSGDARIELN